MRYAIAIIAAALTLVAGCGKGATSGGVPPAGVNEAEVYQVVLRRYLTQPSENSFPDKTFKTFYLKDQAYPNAGEPEVKRDGVPISAQTQSLIVADLATRGEATFVSDADSVLDNSTGCAVVKNDGILITLGTIDGDDKEVKVGINGYVACLGATWLTYVVENPTGTGWIVKGTTGPMAIS